MVPFREQSIHEFLAEVSRHMPIAARLAPKLAPSLVRKRIEALANGPGGSLRWFADDDRLKIRAYFGSQAAWDAIPRDWDNFVFAQPSRTPTLLDHGYDETSASEEWRLTDLQSAAAFRGGRCHASSCDGPDVPVDWECAAGHRFAMTPNLYMRGGHWCPTCMIDPASYREEATRNPFFTQVWHEEAQDRARPNGVE